MGELQPPWVCLYRPVTTLGQRGVRAEHGWLWVFRDSRVCYYAAHGALGHGGLRGGEGGRIPAHKRASRDQSTRRFCAFPFVIMV